MQWAITINVINTVQYHLVRLVLVLFSRGNIAVKKQELQQAGLILKCWYNFQSCCTAVTAFVFKNLFMSNRFVILNVLHQEESISMYDSSVVKKPMPTLSE